ncbi:MAG: hypothetical protein AAF065_02450 [Verrucomicrobiota bacterium]
MKLLPLVFALLAGTGLGYLLFHEEIETNEDTSLDLSIFEDVVPASYSVNENPENPSAAPLAPMLIEEIDDFGAWLFSLNDLPRSQQSVRLDAVVASLSTSEYGRVIDSLVGVESELSQTFIDKLWANWAETDPKGILVYLDTLPRDDARQKRRAEALDELARVDFNTTWAYVQSLPDGVPFAVTINSFLKMALEYNPERVLQILQQPEFEKDQNLQYLYRDVFNSIAKSDPSRAQSLASNLLASQQKTSALNGLVMSIYGKDTVAARAWLESLTMDSSVNRALLYLNSLNNPATIEEAEFMINSEPDIAKRRQMIERLNIYELVNGKSFDEVLQAYEWLEANSPARTMNRRIRNFINEMMKDDQTRTVDFVLDLPLGQSRMNAIGNLASLIANNDVAAAMDFANSLDFEDERQAVLNSMANSMMRDGPENAIEQLYLLDNVYLERRLAGRISSDLAAYDYGQALTWMNNIEDEKAFNEAQTSLVKTLAAQDMQQAVDYVLSDVAPKEHGKFLSMSVLSISKQDPEEAIDWLNKNIIEDPRQLDRLYRDVTSAYMGIDTMAASEWVAGLETGPQRDSAVQGLVNNIVRYDPDSALIWSSTIENEKSRMNMMQGSVRQLLQKDPKAAEAAILDANISDEERDKLLKLVKS